MDSTADSNTRANQDLRGHAQAYRVGDFVEVRGIGPAKIESLVDGTYFLFFFNGNKGQGWRDHDITGKISQQAFWAEWRKAKRYG